MPKFIDPHDAYLSFREEVQNDSLQLESCKLHPDIKMYFDEVDSGARFTYATFKNKIAKGILQIAQSGWDNGIPYFQLGIAVGKEFRKQGVGEQLTRKALEEFLERFPIPKGEKLGIEAVISTANIASQKLAAKIFPKPPTAITDSVSGKPALHYEFVKEG
ncbi:MAG: GNAT family N-acetyltransferase [Desulfovibrio sp.]|uniref:GNAT family N-acetyltransferase n=1 Tax=Desulfovibrio sp. TaxID=885 RepID=UPI00135D737E|nr:GNAT family N-acetyltransferase [Desulfovibrio sp.]MTJ92825.1 GNAT family N-acetyltransferase [Desulfovibrio sp.]